jgi:hypothetical protein
VRDRIGRARRTRWRGDAHARTRLIVKLL